MNFLLSERLPHTSRNTVSGRTNSGVRKRAEVTPVTDSMFGKRSCAPADVSVALRFHHRGIPLVAGDDAVELFQFFRPAYRDA